MVVCMHFHRKGINWGANSASDSIDNSEALTPNPFFIIKIF